MDVKQHNAYIRNEMAGPKIKQFMDLILNRIEGYVIKNLSGRVLKVRTGRLRSAVTTSVKVKGAAVEGSVGIVGGGGAVEKIANVWEFTGRKKFFLTPKNKKALSFMAGGKRVFSKGHWIPGERPRPFISPAFDKATPYIYALHAKRFAKIFNFNIEIRVGD